MGYSRTFTQTSSFKGCVDYSIESSGRLGSNQAAVDILPSNNFLVAAHPNSAATQINLSVGNTDCTSVDFDKRTSGWTTSSALIGSLSGAVVHDVVALTSTTCAIVYQTGNNLRIAYVTGATTSPTVSTNTSVETSSTTLVIETVKANKVSDTSVSISYYNGTGEAKIVLVTALSGSPAVSTLGTASVTHSSRLSIDHVVMSSTMVVWVYSSSSTQLNIRRITDITGTPTQGTAQTVSNNSARTIARLIKSGDDQTLLFHSNNSNGNLSFTKHSTWSGSVSAGSITAVDTTLMADVNVVCAVAVGDFAFIASEGDRTAVLKTISGTPTKAGSTRSNDYNAVGASDLIVRYSMTQYCSNNSVVLGYGANTAVVSTNNGSFLRVL